MRFFVQSNTLKKADTPYKLHKLDANKQDSLMFKTDIQLSTSAKEVLKKVLTSRHQGLIASQVMVLKTMAEKIQEKKST